MTVAEMTDRDLLLEGRALQEDGDYRGAEERYRTILQRNPDHVDALNLQATVALKYLRFDAAAELLQRAVAIDPYHVGVRSNLAHTALQRGDVTNAVAELRRAITIDPSSALAHSNLIFALDVDGNSSVAERRAARADFDRLLIRPRMKQRKPHANDCDPDRKLRVGYLSGDFRLNSAACASLPIVEAHDPDQVEVVLLNTGTVRDAITERFAAASTEYLVPDDDMALATIIRSMRIDILVDVAGFSSNARPLALAHKPAPIQVSAWGYTSDTTGLSCFDAIVADDVVLPPGDEAGFAEREILRLPAVLPYLPLADYPDVAPAPCVANGYVTFGYFGRVYKLSEATLRAWAEILLRVPDSRLVLKGHHFGDDVAAARVVSALVARGVTDDRIEVLGADLPAEHAKAYAKVDVMLDAHPQNQQSSASEGLYMGVPHITLLGEQMGGRVGASLLTAVGAADLVTTTVDEYVSTGVRYAAGGPRCLAFERSRWRARFQHAAPMRYGEYARALEAEYRRLWQAWLREGA